MDVELGLLVVCLILSAAAVTLLVQQRPRMERSFCGATALQASMERMNDALLKQQAVLQAAMEAAVESAVNETVNRSEAKIDQYSTPFFA